MSERFRKFLVCVGALVLLILIGTAFFTIREKGLYNSTINLNYGWTLIFRGDTIKIESTDSFVIPSDITKDDSLILERKLTAELPDNPVLRFRTYNTFVETFRNNEKIYSNGESRYYNHDMIGNGVHFVYLGAASQEGKNLRLIFHYTDDFLGTSFPPFEVLPINNAFADFSARNSISLMIALFLVQFGILALFISAGMLFFRMQFFQIFMIALIALSLGIWTLCYSKLIQLISLDFAFNTQLEFFTLYISPLPLCLLLLHMRYRQISKKLWLGFAVIASIDLLFVIVTTILHHTHILHYIATLGAFHAFLGLSLVYLFIVGMNTKSKVDTSTRILTVGVATLGIFSILDLLRFNLMFKYHLEHTALGITWIPIGTITFIIMLVVSYLVYIYHLISAKAEKDILSILAYRDSLTGIYNRAKCQQVFDLLDQTTTDFAIVSTDLNGLKLTNDRYGHNKGDLLIKAFAIAFHKAFVGIGTTIRMGGDEFLAIIRTEHINEVDTALSKMKELQKTYSTDLPIPLEAAYGLAYRHELSELPNTPINSSDNDKTEETVQTDSEKVYQLADERMYEMKSKMKSKLVRR